MAGADLKKIFISKFEKQELAHFYILETNSQDPNFIDHWLLEMLKDVTKSELSMGHSDIEIVETENDYFKLDSDEVKNLYSFISYAPLKLKYKFLVIKDAQKINQIFSNKLLKILEEPPKNTIIMLTNPHATNVLATIKSRAITLRLNEENKRENTTKDTSLALKEWFKTHYPQIALNSISQVLSDLKANSIDERELLRAYIEYLAQSQVSGNQLEHELEKLKEQQLNAEYNQSLNSKYIPILDTLFRS